MILSISPLSALFITGAVALLGCVAGYLYGRREAMNGIKSGPIFLNVPPDEGGAFVASDGPNAGLVEVISAEFAMMIRYKEGFSLVAFDVDGVEQMEHARANRAMRKVERQLTEAARETDAVVRQGGNRFFVLMPRTGLMGACEFAERFRETVEDKSPVTVSGGLTCALDGDSPDLMLERIDESLASAERSGGNCTFRHDGYQVEPVLELVFTDSPDGDAIC